MYNKIMYNIISRNKAYRALVTDSLFAKLRQVDLRPDECTPTKSYHILSNIGHYKSVEQKDLCLVRGGEWITIATICSVRFLIIDIAVHVIIHIRGTPK
ncbi:hypothetical protein CDAR_236751 [Caerostris darwini]|uniref:Uncharacterized protein n=1 Tax=Caerostris darwini TaxID=1538125 RepID=A0AAV4S7R6_9ARAC|nr:hypothetical protein CDAR_236751 [Caerostris darwini]